MLKIWKIQVIIDTLKREEEETSSIMPRHGDTLSTFWGVSFQSLWVHPPAFFHGFEGVVMNIPTSNGLENAE